MLLSSRSANLSFPLVMILLTIVPKCYSTSLVQYQTKFATLGRSINFKMVQVRENERTAFDDIRSVALGQIGDTSIVGRYRTQEVLDFIESFNGELSSWEAVCYEDALDAQTTYARLFGDDISQCSDYFHGSILELRNGKQYVAAHSTANRLASETVTGALHVLLSESDASQQLQALSQRLLELEAAWLHLQFELETIADYNAKAYTDALNNLELCLAQSVLFFNYTIAYVKKELETCFAVEQWQ